MRKTKLFNLCLLFLVGLFVISCSQDAESGAYTLDEGSLNATGQAFMDVVRTRPDWEADWQRLSKAGTPLPNEAICFGVLSTGESYYAIPVVSGNEIASIAFFRTVYTGENDEIGETQAPEIIARDEIDENYFAKRFMNAGMHKSWTEDNRYDLSVKLTPIPLAKELHQKTVDSSKSSTRSNQSESVTYYAITFTCDIFVTYHEQYSWLKIRSEIISLLQRTARQYSFEMGSVDFGVPYSPGTGFTSHHSMPGTLENCELYSRNATSRFNLFCYSAIMNARTVRGVVEVSFSLPETREEIVYGTRWPGEDEVFTITTAVEPEGSGVVIGGGKYPCNCRFEVSAVANLNYKFSSWGGDPPHPTNSYFSIMTPSTPLVVYTRHYIARFRPCFDANRANPVTNMSIVPPASGNIDNGDYLGRGGNHTGIDIGTLGDPIYAMFDGTISLVINHLNPNTLWSNYTDQSSTAKTGNRVDYTSEVNGQTIYIQCWHMSTVENLTVGQQITAGTLLGRVGKTGNASSPDAGNPHLHLQIRSNDREGSILDPHNYIYSTYNKDAAGKLQNNGEPTNPLC